jgi:hypothetical protein
MECRPIWAGWLGLVAGVICVTPDVRPVRAGEESARNLSMPPGASAFTLRTGLFSHRPSASQDAAAHVPVQEMPPGVRANVQLVLEKPTLFTRGPSEVFSCCPAMYRWLLDHPDQAVRLWRRLGATCTEIQNRGHGVFGWSDGQGSDVRWWTVHSSPRMRVWYAEGSARAAGMLPLVPVRAVVVLHHAQGRVPEGKDVVQHQADMFLQTDSKTAALVARLMGASAPRMAEQCAGQVEMFFSALAWYLDRYPHKAEATLQGILPADAPEWRELRQRAQAPYSPATAAPSSFPLTGM